jgi:ERCC4-type nuclease
MKIIIDEREAFLYEKCEEYMKTQTPQLSTISISKQVLPLGDILFQTNQGEPIAIIERKTLQDLLSSLKDGRYAEQSHRLTHTGEYKLHNVVYLIEGVIGSLKTTEKRLVYSTICSLQIFKDFSILRTSSLQETAELLIAMGDKIERNIQKGTIPPNLKPKPQTNMITTEETDQQEENQQKINTETDKNYCNFVKKVKRDNITKNNIGEIILCQIPGISSISAIAIMKNFNSFSHFMDELRTNPNCLDNITIETAGKPRKINKNIVESIHEFLT